MASGTELKAAEKKHPQAEDTFMMSVEASEVMRKAKAVGRSCASQYAIIVKIRGSKIKPGS